MPTPINILFVNQETPITFTLQHAIRKKPHLLKLIGAPSVEEAQLIINRSRLNSESHESTIDIVIMKALTIKPYSTEPLTLDLIKELSVWYKGPIVALSSQPDFLSSMMKAGCTHEFTVGLGGIRSLKEFVEKLAVWTETKTDGPKQLVMSFLSSHLNGYDNNQKEVTNGSGKNTFG